MNPIVTAIKGKGLFNFMRRNMSIVRRYGLTPDRMEHALAQFSAVLRRFGCGATFPLTSVALSRNSKVIQKYNGEGIEFAIHGYRHIDHWQLSLEDQLAQLAWARRLFEEAGIQVQGFRGPYLHANSDTLTALRQQNLFYDSSQALAWDVLDGHETPAYLGVLKFYGALSAEECPSLPVLEEGLVRIPYSLPDDEALVERLDLETTDRMSELWLAILHRTFELGELFVLGLHPERIAICKEPLEAVLREAFRLEPAVWVARLDAIAEWWRERAAATVKVTEVGDGKHFIVVEAPPGATVVARDVVVDAPTVPWIDGYRQVEARTFGVQASRRPFIGLSPTSTTELADFLRQQGYIVEISAERECYSYYFDQADFTVDQKRSLVAQIEETRRPLVRLSRWPNGARSALAVTGDIDALTLGDFGFRILGR